MPNGDTCDSLTTDMYEVSCARNPRVKFKVNLMVSSQYVPIRAVTVNFLKARPPQWWPHCQHATAAHYVPEWKFWLGFCQRGNTTHIHVFCIPLDFLGIKDPKKNKKRPNFFSKATDKAIATLIEIS